MNCCCTRTVKTRSLHFYAKLHKHAAVKHIFYSAGGFARLLEANTHHVNPQSGVHVRPFTQITLQRLAVHDPTNLVVSIITHHGPYSSRYLDLGDSVLKIALMSLAIEKTAVVVHENGSQLWDTFLMDTCIAIDHDTTSHCRRFICRLVAIKHSHARHGT